MVDPKQLKIVDEALMVNGPGAGRCLDVMTGERLKVYHPLDGGEPVTYTLFPYKWDRGMRKNDPGDVFRIAHVGAQPNHEVIKNAINAANFQPYYHWWPERGR